MVWRWLVRIVMISGVQEGKVVAVTAVCSYTVDLSRCPPIACRRRRRRRRSRCRRRRRRNVLCIRQ